jgi:hypothetical protein
MSRNEIFRSRILAAFLGLCLPLASQNKPISPAEACQAGPHNAALDQLAKALVSSQTDEERNALLDQDKELATPALILAMISRAKELNSAGGLRQALAADMWAQGLAEKLGDQIAMFEASFNCGLILNYQGKGEQSVERTIKSLVVAQALDDQGRQGLALRPLGVTSDQIGDFEVAHK